MCCQPPRPLPLPPPRLAKSGSGSSHPPASYWPNLGQCSPPPAHRLPPPWPGHMTGPGARVWALANIPSPPIGSAGGSSGSGPAHFFKPRPVFPKRGVGQKKRLKKKPPSSHRQLRGAGGDRGAAELGSGGAKLPSNAAPQNLGGAPTRRGRGAGGRKESLAPALRTPRPPGHCDTGRREKFFCCGREVGAGELPD